MRYRYRQEIAGIGTGALPEQGIAFLNVARVDIFPDNTVNIIADNRLPAGQVLWEQRFDETAAAAKLIVRAGVSGSPRRPVPRLTGRG